MTDSTYSRNAVRGTADPAGGALLRELFAATPLAIFLGALNGRSPAPTSSRR